ncbi:MAG: DUF1653 domain-containing protein [Pseudonocardiaceae bacterium]
MHAGTYRHWKGNRYRVLFIAKDSNNHAAGEDVVVYVSLDPPYAGGIRTRWKSEFLEQVDLPDGTRTPRFVPD